MLKIWHDRCWPLHTNHEEHPQNYKIRQVTRLHRQIQSKWGSALKRRMDIPTAPRRQKLIEIDFQTARNWRFLLKALPHRCSEQLLQKSSMVSGKWKVAISHITFALAFSHLSAFHVENCGDTLHLLGMAALKILIDSSNGQHMFQENLISRKFWCFNSAFCSSKHFQPSQETISHHFPIYHCKCLQVLRVVVSQISSHPTNGIHVRDLYYALLFKGGFWSCPPLATQLQTWASGLWMFVALFRLSLRFAHLEEFDHCSSTIAPKTKQKSRTSIYRQTAKLGVRDVVQHIHQKDHILWMILNQTKKKHTFPP